MRLCFTKTRGKYDQLTIERDGFAPESIACPKQGMIPHEMVHFAVEQALQKRGFLMRIAGGEQPNAKLAFEATADALERLVETLQADVWSGGVSAEEIQSLYESSCAARQHAPLQISLADIEHMRALMRSLSERWAAIQLGDVFVLELETRQGS